MPAKGSAVIEKWVATAFSDAQRSLATHNRSAQLLLKAFSASPEQFLSAFIHALNRILIVFTREPAVERLVQFISHFAADHTLSTGNLCSVILAYLIEHSNANSRAVRFRCMQIIAATLQALPEEAEVNEEIWDPLLDAVMSCTLDRIPRIRAVSAAALCRLQSTGNPKDDAVADHLLTMLSSDSSAAVRKAAMQAVAVTEYNLPWVMRRTRDVREDVRKTAFETLARKVSPECIDMEQRLSLLRAGLKDRSEVVRTACKQTLLVEGWLEGACAGNVFDLIDLLGCQKYEEDVLMALRAVLESSKHRELLDTVEIDVNNLTSSDVLVLRSLSDTKEKEHFMEKYIPSTLVYAEVLKYYAVDRFASCHLLQICKSIDMSDESGRRNLESTLRTEFLASQNVSEDTIPGAVRAMRRTMLEDEETSRILLDIIQNDILHTSAEDGEEENIDVELEDWQQMRTLNICLEVLRISQQGRDSACTSNSLCLNLVEASVLPSLMSVDEAKRKKALECLGLFCLLDKSGTEARMKLPLFIQVSKTDVPEIQELAMQVIIDFLMLFDFKDNQEGDHTIGSCDQEISDGAGDDFEDGSKVNCKKEPVEAKITVVKNEPIDCDVSSMAEECVSLLSRYLTHSEREMRTIAAQGLARLLFVRRIAPNAPLLAKLLIVHHNPTTEDDDLLRQCLSVFFPAFAMSSPLNRLGLEEAFMQTCRLLLIAPSTSPLSKICVVQLAQYILHLTNPSIAQKRQCSEYSGLSADLIHERLALAILNEIITVLEHGEVANARLYGRILSSFRLSCDIENHAELVQLRKLCQITIDECEDRRLSTVLKKFKDRVETWSKSAAEMQQKSSEDSENKRVSKAESGTTGDEDDISHVTNHHSSSSSVMSGNEKHQLDKGVVVEDSQAFEKREIAQNLRRTRRTRGSASNDKNVEVVIVE